MISLKLQGLDALKAQLQELKAEAAGKALARAARKAFLPVLAAAQALAPVDTGLLRDSIKITVVRPQGGDAVVQVGLRVAASKGAVKLGRMTISAHWRWHFVELGTSKMAAKPFFRPALDQNAQQVLDTLREELVKGLARAVKRQRKNEAKLPGI